MTRSQREFRKHFECFARNGRWGTCRDCPRDISGRAYPEFCENTRRYDHNLTARQLAEQWEARR